MAALAQVQHQVDALIDQVTDLLPVAEAGLELVEGGACGGRDGGHSGRCWGLVRGIGQTG